MTIKIASHDMNAPTFSRTALILNTSMRYVPVRVEQARLWLHVSDLTLADDKLMSSDSIELIIGADLYVN